MPTSPSHSIVDGSQINAPIWSTDWLSILWDQLTTVGFNGLGDAGLWEGLALTEEVLLTDLQAVDQALIGAEDLNSVLPSAAANFELQEATTAPGVDPLTGQPTVQDLLEVVSELYEQEVPDLSTTIRAVELRNVVLPGDEGDIDFTLSNQGGVSLREPVTITAYASLTGQIDATAIQIGQQTINDPQLNVNQSRNRSLKVKIPSTLAAGDYRFLVDARIQSGIVEADTANNIGVSTSTKQVVWQFGNVPQGGNRLLKVPDKKGRTTTFSLKGSGYGEIVGGPDFTEIILRGTDANSDFSINGKPNTEVGKIRVEGSLKRLRATSVDLYGGLEVSGSLKEIKMDDWIGPQVIEIGEDPDIGSLGFVELDEVNDVSIQSATRIGFLKSDSWINTDGQADAIVAPNLGYLKVRGDSDVDVTVAGRLGEAEVYSNLTGTWQAGEVDKLRLNGSVTDWALDVEGDLNKIQVKGDFSGAIAADTITQIQINRNATDIAILAGADFGADGQLGGGDDTFESGHLKQIGIGGSVTNSVIAAGLVPLDEQLNNGNEQLIPEGKIGRLDIGQLSNDSLVAAATFTARQKIQGSIVDPETDDRYLTPSKVQAGDLNAPEISIALAEDTGANSSDGITFNPTLVGTVTDQSAIAKLTIRLGETETDITPSLQSDGTFTLATDALSSILGSALTDGTYEGNLTAEDALGNVSEPVAFAFTLDRSAPGLSVISPITNGNHSSYVQLLGSVGEAGTLSAAIDGGTAIDLGAANSGTLDQQLQQLPLSVGSHQLTLSLTDVAGNATQQVIDFTVAESPFVIGAADPPGWAVTTDNTIILGEANSFVTQAQLPVDLGQTEGSRTLRFAVDAVFDTTDQTAPTEDTLAVYLLDAADPSQTLLDNGVAGTPVFALTGESATFTPGLVTYDGQFVEIDLTALDTASQGLLLFQLLNQDGDTGSRIQVSELTNEVDPEGTENLIFEDTSVPATPGGELSLTSLATNSAIETVFSKVRFNAQTGDYTAQVQLRNTGDTSIGRQSALVFDTLPDGVTLQTISGVDATGKPYVNLRNAIRPGGLAAGALSDAVEITFSNLQQVAFTLQSQVLVSGPNQAPVLAPIGALEVTPGARLAIPLAATDTDGDRVTYSLRSDSDLPIGKLDGAGNLVFTPSPDQVGSYTFTLVATDGAEEVTQEVTLNVVPDSDTTTRITGQVLDTDGTALINTPITLGASETVTDAQGYFTIAVVDDADALKIFGNEYVSPVGETFPFVAEKLPLVLGHELYTGVNNVIDRPIYLPALELDDNVQTTDGAGNITVTNDTLGAQVEVAANTITDPEGNPFTGQLSITEVPTDLTPAALPEGLSPDLVVTIQPGEMTLATPAELTLPNQAGWAAGTEMDLWSINPTTGEFEIVGKGVVSNDGSSIETVEGGIRNSSWHFFTPPAPVPGPLGGLDPNNPLNPDHRCGATEEYESFTSNVSLGSGGILETHELVSYQSLGTTRGVTLTYDSLRADPSPIIHFNVDIPFTSPAPGNDGPAPSEFKLISKLSFTQGDFEHEVSGFEGGQYGLNAGEHFWDVPSTATNTIEAKPAIQADLKDLASGTYEYALQVGVYAFANGQFSGSSSTVNNTVVHVNGTQGQLGNGWGIAGVQELIENADGSVLIIDGNGSEIAFENESGYVSPPGDFSTLRKLDNGTFQRTTKEQTVYSFDSNNRLVSVKDRNGNETQHVYNAAGQLTEIIDPVGLTTQFEYANGRISKIIDPAQRETILSYDLNGNLTQITDPDNSSRQFAYDEKSHMVGETDKRGYREVATYDFAGRAQQAVSKDGSIIKVNPSQVEGLYRSEETSTDPFAAPALPDMSEDDQEVTYSDGRGQVKTTVLDSAGQAVSVRDQAGTQYSVQRNDDNLVEQFSNGRGKQSTFEYDDRGNLTRLVDELSATGYSASGIFDLGNTGSGESNDTIFENKGYFPTAEPKQVIAADLNNDGNLDLVAVNNSPSDYAEPYISTFFGDAQGNFSGGNVVSFSAELVVLTNTIVDDFDGDGNQDIIVFAEGDIYGGGDGIAITFGNGDGTFTEGPSLEEEASPRGNIQALQDLDDDGYEDIVYVKYNGLPTIIFGNPDRSFDERVVLSTDSRRSIRDAIDLADINGDGALDIVRLAETTYSLDEGSGYSGIREGVEIFLNQDNRTFSAPVTFNKVDETGVVYDIHAFEIADLNADGFDDIINIQGNNASVTAILGDATASLSQVEEYAIEHQPDQLEIGDLNGDDQLDIVTVDRNSNTASVITNTGSSFSQPISYVFNYNSRASAAVNDGSLVLHDTNNDGNLDIIAVNEASNSISLLLNQGDGSFTSQSEYAVGESPRALTLNDLNQDGFADILAANSERSKGSISVLLNQRNGEFEHTPPIPDFSVNSASISDFPTLLADMNSDGLDDIVTEDARSIFIRFNNSDATFSEPLEIGLDDSVQGNIRSLAVGDFNQDDTLDIIASTIVFVDNQYVSNIVPIISDESRTLVAGAPLTFSGWIEDLKIGDFNGDDSLDFLSEFYDNDGIHKFAIWSGDGTGGFQQEPVTITTTSRYDSLEKNIGDFNSDGFDDIIYLYRDNGSDDEFVTALLSNGDSTFTSSFTQQIASRRDLELADFDGDGLLDFALTYDEVVDNPTGYETTREYLEIFSGAGDGSFFSQERYEIGRFDRGQSIEVTDVNDDQFADILVFASNFEYGVLSVLLGDETGQFDLQDSRRYQDYVIPGRNRFFLTGNFNLDDYSDVMAINGSTAFSLVLNQLGVVSADPDPEPNPDPMPGGVDVRELVNAKLFTYDDTFSQLTSVTDELGSQTVFTIDQTNGNTLEMRQVIGVEGGSDDIVNTYTYTTLGLVDLETDDLGRVKDYDYDNFGRLTQITLAKGTNDEATQAFGYDAAGNLTRFVDENGNVTLYEYDAMNRLVRQTEADPDGVGGEDAPVTTFAYDAAGNLIETTDARDNTTSFTYDELNRLTQRTDADEQATDYVYDSAGNVIAMTNARGETTTYRYDSRNRLTDETDAEGGITNYTYDADNNLTAIIDARGNRTNYFYDERNRLTTLRDDNGRFTRYDYDAADNLVAVQDRNGHIMRYRYDHLNRLVDVQDAQGNSIQTTYDDVGNIAGSIDPRGNATSYQYDDRNRLIQMTDALDGQTRYGYDDASNLISSIDELGRETTYTYDRLNRLTQVTDPLNHSTNYRYDAFGNLTQVAGELGRVVNYSYDNLNRQTRMTDAFGATTNTRYDEVGNITSVTDELGRTTRYDYDGRDFLTRTTDALGHPITYDYDSVGNLTSLTDALGNQTRYEYDNLNRQTQTIDALGQATITTYDNEGNVLSITDASENVTTYTYDERDLLATETITVEGADLTRTYDYDAVGNLIARVDRNGRTQTFAYDALNRLDTEQWLDVDNNPIRTITYGYDAASQLKSLSDPDAVYTYDYDLAGRLIEVDNNNTPGVPRVVFDYGFDAANNLTSVTDRIDGIQAGVETFDYDLLNRVTQVTQSGNGVADKRVDMAYDAASQMTDVSRFSDLAGTQAVAETTYRYDAAGRLTDLTHQRGPSILADYGFSYDAADRLTQLVTPDGTSDYSYNNRSELTGADHNYQDDEAYNYDATGNRTSNITGDHNRLLSDGTYTYEYDNEGNRTRQVDIATGETTNYTWDHRNRLTAVVTTSSDGTVTKEIAYTYDAYDRRIAKVVDADGEGVEVPTEERFVYDGDHIALVFDGDGNQTHRYLHGPQIDQVLAEETADGETRWALTDHQGSVRDVVDNQGTVLNHITYDSFGQVTSETNPDINFRFGYTGRELDEETGLIYYRARYFDPAAGTFVSEDPLGFDAGDANIYRYVFNNPTNFTDPSGNFAQALSLGYGAKLLAGAALTNPVGWAIAGVVVVGVGTAYLVNRSRNNASSARSAAWDFDDDFSYQRNGSNIDKSVVTAPQRKPEPLTNPLGPSLPPFNEVFPNGDSGIFDHTNGGGFCEEPLNIDDLTETGPLLLPDDFAPPFFTSSSNNSLTPAQRARIRQIDNVINHSAKPHDFEGVRKELQNIDTGFDHITEMRQSVRSLEKSIQGIKGSLRNPNLGSEAKAELTSALQRGQVTLDKMKRTLQGD